MTAPETLATPSGEGGSGGRGGEGEKETGRGRYILIPEEFLMYVRVHLCFKAAIVSAKLGRIVFHLSKGKMEEGWKGFLALWTL